MKKTNKRLALRGETVRQLTDLGFVRGAGGDSVLQCGPSTLTGCSVAGATCECNTHTSTTVGPITTFSALTCVTVNCAPH